MPVAWYVGQSPRHPGPRSLGCAPALAARVAVDAPPTVARRARSDADPPGGRAVLPGEHAHPGKWLASATGERRRHDPEQRADVVTWPGNARGPAPGCRARNCVRAWPPPGRQRQSQCVRCRPLSSPFEKHSVAPRCNAPDRNALSDTCRSWPADKRRRQSMWQATARPAGDHLRNVGRWSGCVHPKCVPGPSHSTRASRR
jgi:hypothetical protein